MCVCVVSVDTHNMVPCLDSGLLDMCFVMSYDSDMHTVPYADIFTKFRSHFQNTICMGVETPPEGYGKHITTRQEVADVCRLVSGLSGAGLMLWELGKADGALKAADVVAIATQKLGNV